MAGNRGSDIGKFRSSIVSDLGLDLDSVGSDNRGDLYEITRDDGEYPVCLTVSYDHNIFSDEPQTPYASVDEGPC